MAFQIRASLQALQSLFQQEGYFRDVRVGEPKAPTDGCLALFMMDIEEPGTTLASTTEVYGVMARIYWTAFSEPAEAAEFGLADAVSKALALMAGSFTLGGNVRAIDWASEEGGGKVGVKWGHVDVSGTMFRIADITIPLIVDDAATFVA